MIAQIDKTYIQTRPYKLWSRLLSYALFEGRPLTTSGRWINPFIFAHFAIEKKLPITHRVDRPIFILGTGRSGTTILGIVLSIHRDIGFLNEPKALWNSLRDDEDLIGSYSQKHARYRLDENDATEQIINAAHRIYQSYLFVTVSNRVVDKYPELIFRTGFVKKIFPDARFLFLSRNGWDTCGSIEQWSTRLGVTVNGQQHDWWGINRRKWDLLVSQIIPEHNDLAPYQHQIASMQDHRIMAAVEWIVTMREGLSLLERNPESVMHVPYELLCQQPDLMIQKIAAFTNLQPDTCFLDYANRVLSSPSSTYPEFELPEFLVSPFKKTQEAISLHSG